MAGPAQGPEGGAEIQGPGEGDDTHGIGHGVTI